MSKSMLVSRRIARFGPNPRSGSGGTLLGVFVGMALGIGMAAAVAFYLMRAGSPYPPATTAITTGPSREAAKAARAEPASAEKPRFDFYKILPGVEEPKTQAKAAAPDRITAERAASPEKAADRTVARIDERKAAEPKTAERFWLQAGSFTAENDAENLRARLALAGWEAAVQPASVPDKGTRYRVRLGPYDNTDELNRVKGELGKRGFEVAVIKN